MSSTAPPDRNQHTSQAPVECPLVDARRVKLLGRKEFCACHWKGLVVASTNLATLHILSSAARRPEAGYAHAAGFSAFARFRLYPCQCQGCWLKHLRDDLAKAQQGELFEVAGHRFDTALSATIHLWDSTMARLDAFFQPTAFMAAVGAVFRDAAEAAGLLLKDDLTPAVGPSEDPIARARLFVRHTSLLLETVSEMADLLSIARESGLGGEEARAAMAPVTSLLAAEMDSYPADAAAQLVRSQLSGVDLKGLADEVEVEFSRAVCALCFGPEPRFRPQQETHDLWAREAERGLTPGQIAKKYTTDPDNPLKADTVRKALRRLRK